MEQKIGVIQHPIKWKSESQYIDIKTGEIISKKVAERDYIKLRTRKNAILEDRINGTIKWTHECERNKQLRLYKS